MNDVLEVLMDHLRTEFGFVINDVSDNGRCLFSVAFNVRHLYIEVLPAILRIFDMVYPYERHDFELADPAGLERSLVLVTDLLNRNVDGSPRSSPY